MMQKVISQIQHKISGRGLSVRSRKLRKNVLISMGVKGGNMLIGYIRFPIILSYLGATFHGLWLTLGSMVHWMRFLNIGLGNGLKNKLAEAIALEDFESARRYVSTTYVAIGAISMGTMILVLPFIFLINWTGLLNVDTQYEDIIRLTIAVMVGFFCLRLFFSLIYTILSAHQLPAYAEAISFLASLTFFGGVLLLYYYAKSSIVYIALIINGIPLLYMIIFSIILFNGTYKHIRPSIKYFDRKVFPELTSLGLKFFVVQIAVIILFSTDNFIISNLFGPEEVVPYAVARKYMGVLQMGFVILVNPYWAAFTDAFTKNDKLWIKRSITTLHKFWALLVVGMLILFFIAPFVYHLWIKDKVTVPWQLTILMGVFVLIRSWNSIYSYFLNGVGKIKLQLYISLTSTVFNIPLSIFFGKYLGMGPSGVILATIVCLLSGAVLHPIQYNRIINDTAKGIWSK
ncbi:oligosaccharide flippase family protein [Carboxylicivirga sediminis]|uniref:Oligosaccharide flippase family protein n=1 Tax=Carboxylicivirga sediminis TaxID=2006564 RepID=A0A941F818_9BACT|nr:oligosaccharide flippase family protein [Carboxylicivirga sediminis]MBR8537488.1 oligosaccharide flippase family protein [Carboxylicivirga sediminis]